MKFMRGPFFICVSVGEASGKGPRGLATRLPGSGGLQHLQAQAAGTVAGDVSRARMVCIGFCLDFYAYCAFDIFQKVVFSWPFTQKK